jgi:hypothetical protein
MKVTINQSIKVPINKKNIGIISLKVANYWLFYYEFMSIFIFRGPPNAPPPFNLPLGHVRNPAFMI